MTKVNRRQNSKISYMFTDVLNRFVQRSSSIKSLPQATVKEKFYSVLNTNKAEDEVDKDVNDNACDEVDELKMKINGPIHLNETFYVDDLSVGIGNEKYAYNLAPTLISAQLKAEIQLQIDNNNHKIRCELFGFLFVLIAYFYIWVFSIISLNYFIFFLLNIMVCLIQMVYFTYRLNEVNNSAAEMNRE